MTAITDRLPAPLSERLQSTSSALYSRQGREVDVAVGGIPFRLATTNDITQSVETIQVRKDQFDTENDPGEQSLTGWWRRSQSSWHEGAGNLYQESSDQSIANNGFYDSSGVDVFTPGVLTLLKAMRNNVQPSGSQLTRVKSFAVNGVRTNLCTNPSFETNVTGWVPFDGGTFTDLPNITRSTTRFFTGTACGLVDWFADDGQGAPPGITVPAANIAANANFSASLRVWVPTGSVGVQLFGNGVFGTSSGSLKDQWVTLTLHSTATAGGVVQVQLRPATTAGFGQQWYIDSCMIETGVIAGSYFDGNSQNCVWTGTVNNSTSVQTIASSAISMSAVGSGSLYTAPAPDGAYAALHSPAGKIVVDGVISGTTFYDIASDGTLYQGDVASPGTATTWPCGVTPYRLGWGKHRLWMIGGRKLWQPDVTAAGGTAQNPIFTHPNVGWNYTCMAEGPSAMYFGGHDGFTSSIQVVTLDSGGGLPTLSGATATATLPDGELVQEISILAGQLIGIGTSRGFRIGTVGTGGTITYGPLLVEPTGVTACTALTAQSRFFVAAFTVSGGTAIAYRFDTSNPLSDGVYPYAKDISCDYVGSITSLTGPSSTQLVATTGDGRAWYQSTTEYVPSGYLLTGRVRYRTTELKAFKHLGIEIQPLTGAIAADMILEGGSTLALGSITRQGQVFSDSFAINSDPMRYASLKLTLTPTANVLAAPTINSYLLRSIPAVAPQRLITLPLLCYDREKAYSGHFYGGLGFASDRLSALQILEDGADSLVYQNFARPSGAGQTVIIESVKFVQTAPAPSFGVSGDGGILVLQLRTLGA